MKINDELKFELNDNSKAFFELLNVFLKKMYLLAVKSIDFLKGFSFFYLVLIPSFGLHEFGRYLRNKKN